jgi:hypothetical protein
MQSSFRDCSGKLLLRRANDKKKKKKKQYSSCDLKGFFAAIRSNSLPLAFEKAKSLTPSLSAILEVWTLTLPEVQIES